MINIYMVIVLFFVFLIYGCSGFLKEPVTLSKIEQRGDFGDYAAVVIEHLSIEHPNYIFISPSLREFEWENENELVNPAENRERVILRIYAIEEEHRQLYVPNNLLVDALLLVTVLPAHGTVQYAYGLNKVESRWVVKYAELVGAE